jgi:poly(A) polymerase
MSNEATAREVVARLQQAGFAAYWAGGCVRDRLLGREPADFDVATAATPSEVLRLFAGGLTVGAHFGVVLIPSKLVGGENEAAVEVATFRCDGLYSDGRRPDDVRFTREARADVERRDFTINALLHDPIAGETLDFTGGRADLDKGLIRAVGEAEKRFAEDRLRMLRAVRFAARLGFEIEAETMRSIRRQAGGIAPVSCERIRNELTKMLTEGGAERAFALLDETGLLAEVLPEVARLKGVAQPPNYHPEGDVWRHTLLLLKGLKAGAPAELAWACLLHDTGKPASYSNDGRRIRFHGHADTGARISEAICRRLRFSNAARERIVAIVAGHMKPFDVSKMREATFRRMARQPEFGEVLQLHRLDCLASNGELASYEAARQKAEALSEEQLKPQPCLNGHDLTALGYKPGENYQQILAALEDEQLEGRIVSRAEAIAWVREHFQL